MTEPQKDAPKLREAWAELKALLDEAGIYEDFNAFCEVLLVENAMDNSDALRDYQQRRTPSPELEDLPPTGRAEA